MWENPEQHSAAVSFWGRGMSDGGAGQKPDGCPDVSQHPASHMPPLHTKLTSDILMVLPSKHYFSTYLDSEFLEKGVTNQDSWLTSSILQSRNQDELLKFWLGAHRLSGTGLYLHFLRRANYLSGCFRPSLPLQQQWPLPFHRLLRLWPPLMRSCPWFLLALSFISETVQSQWSS